LVTHPWCDFLTLEKKIKKVKTIRPEWTPKAAFHEKRAQYEMMFLVREALAFGHEASKRKEKKPKKGKSIDTGVNIN
jgi:hypothetical protein